MKRGMRDEARRDKTKECCKVLGEIIKRKRDQLHWSQGGLADAADINICMVSNYERGESQAGWFNIVKIAKVLEISLDEILTEIDKRLGVVNE